jgi:hypothetical protein
MDDKRWYLRRRRHSRACSARAAKRVSLRAWSRIDVRFGSLADISERTGDVRFTPESGHAERQHRRPLSANSGLPRWLN